MGTTGRQWLTSPFLGCGPDHVDGEGFCLAEAALGGLGPFQPQQPAGSPPPNLLLGARLPCHLPDTFTFLTLLLELLVTWTLTLMGSPW